MNEFESAFEELWAWCRTRDFAGADPFDALNSRLFHTLPALYHSRFARTAWTQTFKRAPVNLRSLALIPKGKNSKGLALFSLAAIARWRTANASSRTDAPSAVASNHKAQFEREARHLLDELLAQKLENFGGACWGYNFDWQSRAFFAPRGTPTVVPTAFAARAFIEAFEAFGDTQFLDVARSVCDFILHDLQRVVAKPDEICFSYTPRDSSCVYNASLLAGETLAAVGALTRENALLEDALCAARFVVRHQRANGAWAYGAASNQTWTDNFHTAFVLTSLIRIKRFCALVLTKADEILLADSLQRGEKFWRENFFLADGTPKYFDNRTHPIDTHSTASAVIALLELHCTNHDTDKHTRGGSQEHKAKCTEARDYAERLARWALTNMRDSQGFFYYQKKKFYTIRTPYMRWTQSWMAWALAQFIERSEK